MLTAMNWQPPPGPGPQQWPPAQPAGVPGYPPPAPDPFAGGGPVYELSGWWRRVGAALIDAFLVAIATVILSAPVGGFTSTSGTGDNSLDFKFHLNGVGLTINILVFICLIPLVMARTNGRTVGKIATGIRVVREDGQPVDFGFALVRDFLVKNLLFGFAAVFTLGIATLLNYLWPLWDDQNRALHDRMVKSRVVRADALAGGGKLWGPGYAPPSQPLYGRPPAAPPPYGAPPVAPMPGQPSAAPPWGAPPAQQPPVAAPGQPPFPVAPPVSPPPAPPPQGTAPVPPAPPGEYQPPPGFENPVPPDKS